MIIIIRNKKTLTWKAGGKISAKSIHYELINPSFSEEPDWRIYRADQQNSLNLSRQLKNYKWNHAFLICNENFTRNQM